MDPEQLSSRTSFELQFDDLDTAGSKISCIHFQDTADFATECTVTLELKLETRPRTERNQQHNRKAFIY